MQPLVAISQRVVRDSRGERRDALDQRWSSFLHAADALPLCIPNEPEVAGALLARYEPDALLLTGGNDLCRYGGDAPERDETELVMCGYAIAKRLPLLGVCRGMQMLQQLFGVELGRVEGHVTSHQTIELEGRSIDVNSYHNWGTRQSADDLIVTARSRDRIVKAIRHVSLPLHGIMWHPEREEPPAARDVAFVADLFSTKARATGAIRAS